MTVTPIREGVVVPAHTRSEPHEGVVKELEILLERAKAGEVIGIAWCAYLAPNPQDNQIEYGHVGRLRYSSVVGGLRFLEHDMVAAERGIAGDD